MENIGYYCSDFMDQQTGSSAVWAKDNPLINNGEPYFKDRYW